MNYQPKNYITTNVKIACASSQLSKKKRNTAENLLPIDAVKGTAHILETGF